MFIFLNIRRTTTILITLKKITLGALRENIFALFLSLSIELLWETLSKVPIDNFGTRCLSYLNSLDVFDESSNNFSLNSILL